jgi:hypothetical protein
LNESTSTLVYSSGRRLREQLALAPTSAGTAAHQPIPHIEVVDTRTNFGHSGVVQQLDPSSQFDLPRFPERSWG